MIQKGGSYSLWSQGFNWLANHTYRQIPVVIASYSIKNTQPQLLAFEDYVRSPELAKEAGLMCVRRGRRQARRQGIKKVISEFKSRIQSKDQEKPHEFQCPICLQLFNGPVTTSCSHTFCHRCLDEAILFSATCPVCRSQIRGEELVVSKSIEKLIEMFLARLQIEEIEKFVRKEVEYGEWLIRRTVKKEEIDVGDCIDVRDTEFIWCRATVQQIFHTDAISKCSRQAILVHYEGWSNVFNEIIPLDSQRLATYKFYTCRMQIPHYNLSADNNEHLRSPVVTGEYVLPPMDLYSQSSLQLDEFVVNDLVQERLRPYVQQMSQSFPQTDLQTDLRSLDLEETYSQIDEWNLFRNVEISDDSFRRYRFINPVDNFTDSNNNPLNNQIRRFLPQVNQGPENQNNFQNSYRSDLNQSIRPISDNSDGHNPDRSAENIFNTIHQPRRNYSEVILYSENHKQQNRNPNRNRPANQSFQCPFNSQQFDLVDSLELYSGNGTHLRRRLQIANNQRKPNQQYSCDSISLSSSKSEWIINSHIQIDQNMMRINCPNFSFGQANSPQHNQGQQLSQQSLQFPTIQTHQQNKYLQLYFKSRSKQLPFIVEIQAIQNNHSKITQEIKQLQKQQKQMQIDIEVKQMARKKDMEKWRQLSQMIDDYYYNEENPEGDGLDFGQNLDFLCMPTTSVDKTQQTLEDMLERFVEKDIQSQQPQEQKLNQQQPKQYHTFEHKSNFTHQSSKQ